MQALPLISAIGAGIGVVTQLSSMNYQAKVADENARRLEEQAVTDQFAAAQDIQTRDFEARQQIGGLEAAMSASGLDSNSGSMLLRRNSMARLADQDRARLATSATQQLKNTKDAAQSQRSEGRQLRGGRVLAAIGGALSVGTSYLEGAAMRNNYQRSSMGLGSY